MNIAERFWSKVDKDGPVPEHAPELGPCWLWTAGKTGMGYGVFWDGERMVLAHRFARELLGDPIPSDLQTDHLCRNRACVNGLRHTEPVTQRENLLRGVGASALNAAKTHCAHGHEFIGENLRVKPDGRRVCRQCHRDEEKRARARSAR